jgi:hypothetical protein
VVAYTWWWLTSAETCSVSGNKLEKHINSSVWRRNLYCHFDVCTHTRGWKEWKLYLRASQDFLSFLVQPLFCLTMVRCRGVTAFYHTQGHTTVCRTPLDEGSARRRNLYLTTHNTRNRQTFMPPGGIRTCNPSRRSVVDPRLRFLRFYHSITRCSNFKFCL